MKNSAIGREVYKAATVMIMFIVGISLTSFKAFGEEAKKEETKGNEDFVFEKVQEIDMKQKEIIAHASAYIAEKFVSAKSVIELKDPELGKIVGNVVLMNKDAGFLDAFKGIKASMTIDAKDGKYRLRASNIVATDGNYNVSPFGKLEGANRYRIEPMAKRVLEKFNEDLAAYLKKAKSDSNF